MPTDHRNAEREASESSRGTICACTPDDRPGLVDLYRASDRDSTFKELITDLNDAKLASWSAFKTPQGVIQLAMLPCWNGIVYLIANPLDVEREDVIRGFLELAKEVRARLLASGVTDFFLTHPKELRRFGEILERTGFVSAPYMVVRVMYFSDSGEPQRRN